MCDLACLVSPVLLIGRDTEPILDIMTLIRFSAKKATQAAGVLLRDRSGRRDNYMRVLKLLYLADREALKTIDRPILADHFVAMERGPVLSNVYNLIKGEHGDLPAWSSYSQRDRYDIKLIEDPGVDALSSKEVELLQQVAMDHVDDDEWALVAFTHTLPEWIKNDPGGAAVKPIPLRDILEATGRSADADQIEANIKRRDDLDQFFAAS